MNLDHVIHEWSDTLAHIWHAIVLIQIFNLFNEYYDIMKLVNATIHDCNKLKYEILLFIATFELERLWHELMVLSKRKLRKTDNLDQILMNSATVGMC